MAIKLVREFQQKQQIAITPQLKKSIDLLQLSRVEIINKINAEAEDNPFLIKESEVNLSSNYNNDELLINLAATVTLQNHLENQLNDLSVVREGFLNTVNKSGDGIFPISSISKFSSAFISIINF